MQRVKLGIIGCGAIGNHHLKAAKASSLVNIVAVADLRDEAVSKAAKEFGVPEVYGEGADLIDSSSAEAVILAMPTCARTPLALRAFSRGKHVLTEKPVAMKADEVRQMIAARGDLVGACCSSRFRFTASATAATEFLAGGALGDLRVVRSRVIQSATEPPKTTPPAWRLSREQNGGGILMNWGCYDLDYLLGLTGWRLKPRRVMAQAWTVPPAFESWIAPGSDAETHYAAFVRCEGGEALTLERAEYCPARADAAWEISGSRGTLVLHMTPGSDKSLVFYEGVTDKGTVARTIWEGDDNDSVTMSGPVEDFALAILEGRSPKTTLERALVVQEISDAIYQSAETGAAVEIA
ncbi:MAG: Gfo/Idh/MocA family protein [Armatimonadota bacterium]